MKFEFYGWFIVIGIIINLLLVKTQILDVSLLSALIVLGLSAFIYAQVKNKNIKSSNFWLNCIITYLILIVIMMLILGISIINWVTW